MIFKSDDNINEQRAVLVGFNHNSNRNEIYIQDSMEELQELVYAAGADVLDVIIQNKATIDVRFYIGKGKVEEVRLACEQLGANLVVFNDELSGAQMRNLSDALEIEVVDRTAVILDIFAKRAKTKEGKLQVELAQLKYRLPRLIGFGKAMSRVGGSSGGAGAGIGNRGPGEQKLELDKRRINDRITDIRRELDDVRKNRAVQRVQRKKSDLPIVALVGYTNAGKSTVMNYFVSNNAEDPEKTVFEKDMLFATLETANRRVEFEGNKSLILTDTVGFVSKLPHNLVEAFKATLEEVTEADLLVHVVDASNEKYQMQIGVTEKVLKELGVENTPFIYAFNKIDRVDEHQIHEEYPEALLISAKNGTNMDLLVDTIKKSVFSDYVRVKMMIPYADGAVLSHLMEQAQIFSQEYVEEGTLVDVEVSTIDSEKLKKYIF
ncbi:GTPase HflX [Acidaminobacter sp. JC074]|uniref:GTPase HflX n=1 Tax=Acidaminobacter sp. JC074 TaxID=2530199 RepID=UPI001F0FAC1A|nr:GTPase HflX [Acidaminobacter sp. JC074]MCH4889428.1 GTPase HflX [Acidaminobacter sp. JC074]